ncbi:WecB/TagA/CpsF family glycosyltransferase [Fredinandcohnia humi]
MVENVYFFGVKITVGTVNDFINEIVKKALVKEVSYICVSNVHTTIMASEDYNYRGINNNSFMSITDGMPLVYISKKYRGKKGIERLTGPDLMLKIFEDIRFKDAKHYFYGSTEQTLNSMINNLNDKFNNLKIAGYYSPPYRQLTEEEQIEIVNRINSLKPDFIWVGLGAPKQERWMSGIVPYLHQGILVGVGAAFDYHANNIKRAPFLLQKFGLEWLYRLIQEPKRLFKRYLITNSKFVYKVFLNEVYNKRENGD